MQTYETYLPPRVPAPGPASGYGQPYRAQPIPGMRPAQPSEPLAAGFQQSEPQSGSSTPIFDALYSEFRRLFKALPGDRSGEEDLRFTGFGSYGGAQGYGSTHGYGSWDHPPYGRHRSYLALGPGSH